MYEGVKPTLGELEKFEATPDEVELNGKSSEHITCKLVYTYGLIVTSGGDGKAGSTLAPGDIVEVCEGQLMHLQGKVINVEGDVITIMPKHEDLKVHTCLHTCAYTHTHTHTHTHTDSRPHIQRCTYIVHT